MPYISGGGSGGISTLTAADTSVVVAGTATAKTVRTNTLDVIAAQHAAASDWSNNSHKITGLANGTAASDAAAFGQISGAVVWPPKSLVGPLQTLIGANSLSAVGPGTSNMWGSRVLIPYTGTLHDLSVFIGTSSGNIDIGILDTTATTRNRLYHSGSTASPGTGWRIIGDPALSVTAGDMVDFCITCDNNTITIGFVGINAAAAQTLPTNFILSPLGGAPKMSWLATSNATVPATIAESSLAVANTSIPMLIARIA